MRLHFGQILLPYKNGETSVDVAKKLEKRYKLKATFFAGNKPKIAQLYRQALSDALNDAIHGGFVPLELNLLFGKANDTTSQLFRDALNKRWFDGRIAGVPTMRAQLGISSRFKAGFTRKKVNGKWVRISRPSFIDTQLYRNSSKTWVE